MRTAYAPGSRFSRRNDRDDLISPVGKSHKNDSSSPYDRTVAETPSPGGNSMFSPASLQVKALPKESNTPFDESPTKNTPFDEGSPIAKTEVQRDFDSVWETDDGVRDRNFIANNRETGTSGRKSSQYMRYMNRISSDMISPVQKSTEKAPVPFVSTGSPPPSDFGDDSFSNTPEHYNSAALTNEIARAQKLGTNEGRSKVRPHSLFRSNGAKYGNQSSLKLNHVLAREISDAAEEGAVEYQRYHSETGVSTEAKRNSVTSKRLYKARDPSPQKKNEDPFDCGKDSVVDSLDALVNISSMRYMEEAKKYLRKEKVDEKTNYYSVRKHRESSSLTPNQVLATMKILRESDPPQVDANDEKVTKDRFGDEVNALLNASSGDEDLDPSFSKQGSKSQRRKFNSDEKEGRNWARTALLICLLLVLVICGIIAALFASGKFSKNTSNLVSEWDEDDLIYTESQTSPPTEWEETNVFAGSKTVACTNAIPLTELDRPYYGSNWKAFWDPNIDTCGDQMSTGYAVWYSFSTNSSKLIEASTCDNTDFDTQITVMSGSCGETTCVSFNDQGCGDQSLVTWYAEANTTYYVMVHGFREASGTFGLTLSEAFQHEECDSAITMKGESVLAGTTAGASAVIQPPQCDDVDLTEDGVWYQVGGVSGFYRAELLNGYTDFSGQVSVYRSLATNGTECSALVCEKGSADGAAMWLADATETYYVYVNGKNGSNGDFDLFLGRNKASECSFASRVDANSVGFLASTKDLNPQNVQSCGYQGYHTAPGQWFSVMGTGEYLEASTCGSALDLDTQISVFSNGCDSLQCIGGTGQEHPCSENGSVIWKTELNEEYHVYVSGRSSRVGNFILNINDAPVADGLTCDGSLEAELSTTMIMSNTTNSPSVPVDRCTGSDAVKGAWHKVIGTGDVMSLSVCNNETDFDARVSVFTGSCDGRSCIAYTERTCGTNDKITITTHAGEAYYVFVHGVDSESTGNYHLEMNRREANDHCGMASTLDVSTTGRYFGSTLSAKDSVATACIDEVVPESKALWYAFMGTGETVTLSTCSFMTDFNSDIRIFSGSCSDSNCVADIEESYTARGCGQQSIISFQSTKDELYYARVGGNSAIDEGNFLLEVNPKSRFFGP